ncbi:hypothetical protein NKR23_g1554 [Pleurostoma richardsiae]|uniref:Transcription factor RfeG n=1 Tax=Pleurostoma richardsiae TaxID=41990 RepID=A0AA38VVJ1_9PEZI|nr:hypothetical protein NKR23_g1554 [Pleurostoma richardsiae]
MSRAPRGANAMPAPAAQNRQNEYFVPRDGIDREVITADICRYLGNDALVRPGTYEDKGRVIQGYYITAYRNLTSAMIADLKADSARWEQERRKHQTSGVRYSNSQYRAEQMSGSGGGYQQQQYPGSDAPGYSAGNGNGPNYQSYGGAQGGYGSSQFQMPQQAAPSGYGSATQDSSRYGGIPPPANSAFGQQGLQGHPQDTSVPYMSVGSNYVNQGYEVAGASRPGFPGSQQGFSSNPDPRYGYQQPLQGSSNTAFATQPIDPSYGRASPATTATVGYSPAPEQQSHSVPNARRDREQRESERPSDKHRHYHRTR